MSDIFTTTEIAALSAQVDEQLRELGKGYALDDSKRGETQQFSVCTDDDFPPKQRKDIEDNTKKEAPSFLQEFAEKAKEMLCDAESDLRKDYDLLGEVDKVTLLERFAALLAVMGFSGIGLQVLTVAITVYIIHIGLKPFAEKYCRK
jgi:hypothetical protein